MNIIPPKIIEALKTTRRKFLGLASSQPTILDATFAELNDKEQQIYKNWNKDTGSDLLDPSPSSADLDPEQWAFGLQSGNSTFGPSQLYRRSVSSKIPSDLLSRNETAFVVINSQYLRCLPDEFVENAPKTIARDEDGLAIPAHEFRFIGDLSGYAAEKRNRETYLEAIVNFFGQTATSLLSYFSIKSTEDIEYIPKQTRVEGVEIYTDLKGDKIVLNSDVEEIYIPK